MESTLPQLELLERKLRQRIRGQGDALSRLCAAVGRRESQSVPQRGPRGCFIFAGPTGVGKTETAIVLAETLFGSDRFLRIDCSEFKTIDSLKTLLGETSGDRGRLGRAWSRFTEGVWLWDEIEKAHPELVQLFLQMGDAARLTLACGETLDLRGIYLIVTTNLGSAEIIGRERLTFTTLERHVVRCLEKFFRPELLARFGTPFVFRPLDRAVQAEIAEQRLRDLVQWQLQIHGRLITTHPDVLSFLIHRGFSLRYGARQLVRFVEETLGDAIHQNLRAAGDGSGRLVVLGDHLKLLSQ